MSGYGSEEEEEEERDYGTLEDWEDDGGVASAPAEYDEDALRAAGLFAPKRTTEKTEPEARPSLKASQTKSAARYRQRKREPDPEPEPKTEPAGSYEKGLLSGINKMNERSGQWVSSSGRSYPQDFLRAAGLVKGEKGTLSSPLDGKTLAEPLVLLVPTSAAFAAMDADERKRMFEPAFAKAAAKHHMVEIPENFDSDVFTDVDHDLSGQPFLTKNHDEKFGTEARFFGPRIHPDDMPTHASGKVDPGIVTLAFRGQDEAAEESDGKRERFLQHGRIVDHEDVPGVGVVVGIDTVFSGRPE